MSSEPVNVSTPARGRARAARRLASAAMPVLAAALITTPARPAHACGPDFPVEYLRDRAATLLDLREGEFLVEAGRLVPAPRDPLPPEVVGEPDGVRDRGGAEERALYQRGAEAFHRGESDDAIAAFNTLLALPAAARAHRSTWAAYMLGRIHTSRHDLAITYFQQVRALARAGFADDLGLAMASLGEEAAVHRRAAAYDERLGSSPSDEIAAIHLYAEQAARGSVSGAASLLEVARAIVTAEDRPLRGDGELLADPVTRRLLAAYLYTRAGELTEAAADELRGELRWSVTYPEAADPAGEYLAAITYRAGDWADAARLAAGGRGLLAQWVAAKLHLRRGATAPAAPLLAAVEAGCAQTGDRLGLARIQGERMVLATAVGDFSSATRHALGTTTDGPVSSIDLARLADRLLTIDELRALAPAPAATLTAEPWAADPLARTLAHRLVRLGRHAEAAPYFAPPLRAELDTLAAAHAAAAHAADRFVRAEALFTAAAITRRSGMELMGTEHAPDWALWGGSYAPETTCTTPLGFDPGGGIEPEGCIPPVAADAAFVHPGERARLLATAPFIGARYHYRVVASLLAEAAADLLPERSQAFAATLCHAARYVRNVDDDRVAALYQRYVDRGPAVDFAVTFADECPAPEFDRARRFGPTPGLRWPAIGAGLVLTGLAVLALVCWRRRRPTVVV